MSMPDSTWRVDVFLYRSGQEKGILFLAWRGTEAKVMYANARTGRETPWHGRWDVSAEASKVITEIGRKVKEHGCRVVYFDPDGVEDCE